MWGTYPYALASKVNFRQNMAKHSMSTYGNELGHPTVIRWKALDHSIGYHTWPDGARSCSRATEQRLIFSSVDDQTSHATSNKCLKHTTTYQTTPIVSLNKGYSYHTRKHMMGYIPMCVSVQSKLLPKSSPGPALTGQVGRNKPNNHSRMINQLTLMLITLMGSYSCHRAVNNPIKPGKPWANNPKEN